MLLVFVLFLFAFNFFKTREFAWMGTKSDTLLPHFVQTNRVHHWFEFEPVTVLMLFITQPKGIIALTLLCLSAISVGASVLSSYSIQNLRVDKRVSTLPPISGLKLLLKEHFLYSDAASGINDVVETLSLDVATSLKVHDRYFRLLSPEQMAVQMQELDGLAYSFGFSMKRRLQLRKMAVLAASSALIVVTVCSVSAFLGQRLASLPPQLAVYGTLAALTVAAVSLWKTHNEWFPLVLSSVDSSCSPHLAVGDSVVAVDGIGAAHLSMKDVQQKMLQQEKIDLTLLRHSRSARQAEALMSTLGSNKRESSHLLRWLRSLWIWKLGAPPTETRTPPVVETGRTVCHDQSVIVNVTVAKFSVSVPSTMDYALLPQRSGGAATGYVRIRDFNDQTYPAFTSALSQLRELAHAQYNSSLSALVCDLRGNGGGCLVPALDVAAIFLPRGACLTQLRGRKRTYAPRSTNNQPDLHTALLVLVDGQTASAGEILVQALCDERNGRRATSLGEPTRGKNCAQAVVRLSDGSGVCFSVYEFLTPSGRSMGGGHRPAIVHQPADSLPPHRIRFDPSTRTWSLSS